MARWYHYVGGFYSMAKFIEEAQRLGVTRRVAPTVAKTLAYGDRVVLLNWGTGNVTAFAEFRIDKLTVDGSLAEDVGRTLVQEGRAHFSDGGGGAFVVRACGSYEIGGTWHVDAALDEVVDLVQQAAQERGVKAKLMVGGKLTRVFDEPALLQPPPSFQRGFIPCEDDGSFEYDGEASLVQVNHYQRRARKERHDIQLALPLAV